MKTTYVLAGTYKAMRDELREHGIDHKSWTERLVTVYPICNTLEGRDMQPGDRVLFGHGTTAEMIDYFTNFAWSRGFRLSDLEIIV